MIRFGRLFVLPLALIILRSQASAAPVFEKEAVFEPGQGAHGHVHASCIVECPNGDLRVVWYENGPELPEPAFNKQKDKSLSLIHI